MLELNLSGNGGMSKGGVCNEFHLSMIDSSIVMVCGDGSCAGVCLMRCAQGWC